MSACWNLSEVFHLDSIVANDTNVAMSASTHFISGLAYGLYNDGYRNRPILFFVFGIMCNERAISKRSRKSIATAIPSFLGVSLTLESITCDNAMLEINRQCQPHISKDICVLCYW